MAIFGLNLRKQNSFFRNHKSYFFFYHIRLLISQTNKKYHTFKDAFRHNFTVTVKKIFS